MAKSTKQCSFRFITKRDVISLAVTLGFVVSVPLFVYAAAQEGKMGGQGQMVELSSKGQLIQMVTDKPFQIASANSAGL